MKILQIHTSLSIGGIEAMICALANEMVKSHKVTVCTIYDSKDADFFEQRLDKKISKVTLGKKRQGFSLSEIFKIYKFIKNERFDVVHLHGFFYYYILSVLFLHSKVKFIYTVHSDAGMENSLWDKRLFGIKKFCFKNKFAFPVTISEASYESFKLLYGVDSVLIYNGIKKVSQEEIKTDLLTKYRYTSNTQLFLHAGRITKAKNQITLCKVFERLISEGKDVVLLIAGNNQDNSIFSEMQQLFSDRIVYLGERKDVVDLLSNSDAMCLPSIWEGLPIILLEALSVGCIPICSPVGGIKNVISSGCNGLLSEDSTFESYYNAIINFLSFSENHKSEIRGNCISSFERFDIANSAKDYIKEYIR